MNTQGKLTPQAAKDLKGILDRKILEVESINRDIKYIEGILDKYELTKIQVHQAEES